VARNGTESQANLGVIPGSARFARGPGMTEPVDWFNQINSMESMVWLVEKTWMAVTSTAMTTLKSER
jgi:hypothetical protein